MSAESERLEEALYAALIRERPLRDAAKLQELIRERNERGQEV